MNQTPGGKGARASGAVTDDPPTKVAEGGDIPCILIWSSEMTSINSSVSRLLCIRYELVGT